MISTRTLPRISWIFSAHLSSNFSETEKKTRITQTMADMAIVAKSPIIPMEKVFFRGMTYERAVDNSYMSKYSLQNALEVKKTAAPSRVFFMRAMIFLSTLDKNRTHSFDSKNKKPSCRWSITVTRGKRVLITGISRRYTYIRYFVSLNSTCSRIVGSYLTSVIRSGVFVLFFVE